jgi:hypothetical protein
MKQTQDRRTFMKRLAVAAFSTFLTVSFIKHSKAYDRIISEDPDEKQLPRINPAFQMNVYADGSVELYTFLKEGDKIRYKFEGLQGDILVKLLNEIHPEFCYQELGIKYKLDKETYISDVSTFLKILEDKGIVYYGDLMLVKIMKHQSE